MKEEDIRPEELFRQYLDLAERDAETCLSGSPFRYVPCPAGGSTKSRFLFRKMGFDYEECGECRTLINKHRPPAESFARYYADSPSVKFWATHFYRQTEDARRVRFIRPKAALVK